MIDILGDAKRRQQGNSVVSPKGRLVCGSQPRPPPPDRLVSRVLCATDNIEFILKNVGGRHRSDSQDNDQPDYDSVASDEDTDQDLPSSKADRTKVLRLRFFPINTGPL